jgi:hypothetical protein
MEVEPPLDLVPSFLQAIIFMQQFGILAMLSLLGRLSAIKRNEEPRDCAAIVTITWLPLRLSLSSLVLQSIFVPRNQMENSPTNTRIFSPSTWEI